MLMKDFQSKNKGHRQVAGTLGSTLVNPCEFQYCKLLGNNEMFEYLRHSVSRAGTAHQARVAQLLVLLRWLVGR